MGRKQKHPVLKEVKVEAHAGEGKCLTRLQGKVIFISDVVPGDIVDIRVSRSKKDWAEAQPIFFHQYSQDRIAPFCAHFGICGGCQWQMLSYEKQLEFKQQQVADALQRIGRIPLPPISPIMGAAEQRYYRNKIEYTFSNKKFLTREELSDPEVSTFSDVAGFHAKGLFDKVVDIGTCFLQKEPSNHIRQVVKTFALRHGIPFYDIRKHEGQLRIVQLRICRTGEVMVNVVFAYESPEAFRLLEHLLQEVPAITTLLYTINAKFNDSLIGLEPCIYQGKGFVIESLEDFQFKIGPTSFFQTNTAQAERLYQVTRDFASLTGKECLYDLYCGTGSIGIFLSRMARKVIGVENVVPAIDDARENALLNQLGNCTFFAGDVVDICTEDFFAAHGRPDVIITDPPRAGMHEKLIRMLLLTEAPRLVYVSCNPATQARDVQLLGEKYAVERIQPVDMFPHTQHIENVMLLQRKK
jgi:23S rRNA (uracil1939-C5)-methyltransferase